LKSTDAIPQRTEALKAEGVLVVCLDDSSVPEQRTPLLALKAEGTVSDETALEDGDHDCPFVGPCLRRASRLVRAWFRASRFEAGRLGHRAADWTPAKATVWRTGQRAGCSRRTLHARQRRRRLPRLYSDSGLKNKNPPTVSRGLFSAT
jgi:hypothetical protein